MASPASAAGGDDVKRISAVFVLLLAVSALRPVTAQPGLTEAIATYRARAAEEPRNPEVLTDLGNLLVLSGEMVEAEELYRRVLDLDEAQVTARYNLALLLHQTGRRRPARRQQLKVLDWQPDHAWAHYQLGTLAAEAGDRAAAIRRYAQAFSLDRRLTIAEFNPHILDNELSVQAVMRAYGSSASAALAPRRYEEPGRITRLLVPALGPAEEAAPAEEAPPAPAEAAPRVIETAPADDPEASAPPPMLPFPDDEDGEDESDLPAASVDERPSERADPEAVVREGRRGSSRPLAPEASTSTEPPRVTMSAPAAESAPRPPATPEGRSEAGGGSPSSTARPAEPAETGGTEHRPGLPSTGKVGLRLVPSGGGSATSSG